MADSPLAASLAALSRFFVGEGSLEHTLERVAHLTVDAVGAADLCGITLPVEGHKRTAVFTDATAPEVDQAQYDTGDGPCLATFDLVTIVEIPSTTDPGRWPEFRRVAAAHGILSTLSLPLVVDKAAVGAMNIYARRPCAFGEADRETAILFASQAAIVLANAQAYWDARDLGAGLGEALKNRAVIEQAKGILMAGQGCDEDAAFRMLVGASQRQNVKLREVARHVVDSAVHRARASRPNGARAGR
jgi:GAF domain-containing protein